MSLNKMIHPVNYYVNWALYAILGRMAEADSLLRSHKNEIYSIANILQVTSPIKLKKLYRGILLEPELANSGFTKHDPKLTFASFSEDIDAACFFADPESYVSGFVKQVRSRVEGFIVEYEPELEDILFHYSWGIKFPLLGERPVDLSMLAAQHSDIDPVQFEWNLKTQKEVVVKPFSEPLKLIPYRDLCKPTRDLDRKFLHPHWLRNNPYGRFKHVP